MKAYKYIFLVIGLSILGCSDLEEEPVGLLAPEGFFQSTQDIQTAVNGTYGHMLHEDFWGRKMSLTLMLRSDMVAIGDPTTSSRRIEHDQFNVPADNGMISGYWNRTYQIIAAANNAIAGAELVADTDENKNPIVAQAYFARAFTYFHLVRQFGAIPYLSEPVTDVQAANSISKTSVDDVYANIIADLEFAEQWLPDTQPARSLPAKSAAQSYLALVYLTRGEHQPAYDWAFEVISNEGAYNLDLDPDFQNLFNADAVDSSVEPIFSLDFNGFSPSDDGRDYMPALTGIRGDEQYEPNVTGGGWSVGVPTLAVYNDWDDNDYRKEVSFDDTNIVDDVENSFTIFQSLDSRAVNRPHIAKYTRFTGLTGNGNGRNSSHNYHFMRYAEVLLIAAEALNEVSGGSDEAMGYVNRVRARARSGNGSAFPADVSGLNQDDLRDVIIDERRLELAFEFKRWYDIARLRNGSEVFGSTGYEGLVPGFDPAQDYLLPLPADELSRNPNLLPQNPGY
ncbi:MULTISPECIES: RagB/SusD family nutrient uptake outer membrane protein [Nonlabens]|uniref:Putative outer membrane starch-binding protein n=1 Tax=Nonlabens xylanidelens TaxID=191564 RepID=A0A2S6IJQ1_9FLAO|nr:RagB/SusD family nutrient uptake outer membrane protein [Nonlabens xylanidelens]PPK94428.1 putative outer membrane starch-binding protein [Nonlabens xylanidelens]PQJ21412.1 RagB/SusD family nutrient uptake outer membrane protein [Nonlabens xylanidelens]